MDPNNQPALTPTGSSRMWRSQIRCIPICCHW